MSVRMWDFSCHIENVWYSSSQNWVRNGKDSITFGDSFRMHYLCSQKRITHEEISIAGSCLSLYRKLREGCTGDIPGTENLLRGIIGIIRCQYGQCEIIRRQGG